MLDVCQMFPHSLGEVLEFIQYLRVRSAEEGSSSPRGKKLNAGSLCHCRSATIPVRVRSSSKLLLYRMVSHTSASTSNLDFPRDLAFRLYLRRTSSSCPVVSTRVLGFFFSFTLLVSHSILSNTAHLFSSFSSPLLSRTNLPPAANNHSGSQQVTCFHPAIDG